MNERRKQDCPKKLTQEDHLKREEEKRKRDEEQRTREELVGRYQQAHGWDFYMVDPGTGTDRDGGVRAAPFHIENEKDVLVFVLYASPLIDWIPSKNAVWSLAAKRSGSLLQSVSEYLQ